MAKDSVQPTKKGEKPITSKRRTDGGYMATAPMKMPERKPEFSITDKDLPAIKDWKVGKKYSMELNVEMVSIAKGSEYGFSDDKNKHNARFKILSIDSAPESDEKE